MSAATPNTPLAPQKTHPRVELLYGDICEIDVHICLYIRDFFFDCTACRMSALLKHGFLFEKGQISKIYCQMYVEAIVISY